MTEINICTVCTKNQPNLRYWKLSLEKCNFRNVNILGYNEKWGGWKFRTRKYIQYLESLNPKTIVVCCDSNDLYFILDHDILLSRYKEWDNNQHNKNCVLVGGEPGCCTGTYTSKQKSEIKSQLQKLDTKNRYIFPNGGFVMGLAENLLKLYNYLENFADDQQGILQLLLFQNTKTNYLKINIDDDLPTIILDKQQLFCGNIPSMHKLVATEQESAIFPPYGGGMKNEIQIFWSVNNNEIYNKFTHTTPVVLHFPGAACQGFDYYIEIFNKIHGTNYKFHATLYLRFIQIIIKLGNNLIKVILVLIIIILLIIKCNKKKNKKYISGYNLRSSTSSA